MRDNDPDLSVQSLHNSASQTAAYKRCHCVCKLVVTSVEETARNAGTAEAGVAMGTYHGDWGWGLGWRRGQGGGCRAVWLGTLHRKCISSLVESTERSD